MARCNCKKCEECGDSAYGIVLMHTETQCFRLLLCHPCYEQNIQEIEEEV